MKVFEIPDPIATTGLSEPWMAGARPTVCPASTNADFSVCGLSSFPPAYRTARRTIGRLVMRAQGAETEWKD